MDEETVWFESILNKSFRDKEVHRVLSVDLQSAVPEGNNYASIIQRATLKVILRSGRKSTLTLIVKKSLEVKEKSKLIDDFSFFKAEITMYNSVILKFEKLMNEYQDTCDELWCKLIGYKPYNLIVLEDLKRENFKMADRTALLDKLHALISLHGLARFHAMGFVLQQKGLIVKGDLSPHYMEIDSLTRKNFVSGGYQQLINVMSNNWSSDWKVVAERLSKNLNIIFEKVLNSYTTTEDGFVTICHGDCWTSNIMFKYCSYDENVPIAVKFLDFQSSHFNSYAFDIIFFLYSCVQPDVRRIHWNDFISKYQETLASTLSFYGIEGKAPAVEDIERELKRLEHYAMLVNLIYLPITSTEVENPILLEKLDEEWNGGEAFNPKIFDTEKYKKTVQFELKKWFNEGLF
ncbi:uncharacterized protein isoform X2 [Rhodnius prolixus]|uniref:CHK kinase-like domain-containing protein n=1 Tax=Rhodnius prolixus TaxID=13249 RepID=A0A905QWR7_RHOPR